MKKLLEKIKKAEKIYNHPELDWEWKYDFIFGLHIWQDARNLNLRFEWYDPDTSYEEELKYYMEEVMNLKKALEVAHEA